MERSTASHQGRTPAPSSSRSPTCPETSHRCLAAIDPVICRDLASARWTPDGLYVEMILTVSRDAQSGSALVPISGPADEAAEA